MLLKIRLGRTVSVCRRTLCKCEMTPFCRPLQNCSLHVPWWLVGTVYQEKVGTHILTNRTSEKSCDTHILTNRNSEKSCDTHTVQYVITVFDRRKREMLLVFLERVHNELTATLMNSFDFRPMFTFMQYVYTCIVTTAGTAWLWIRDTWWW